MANIKSKEKNMKRIEKRTTKNRMVKSKVRTAIRAAKEAVVAKNENAKLLISKAHKEIDKAVSKGVLHKKTGARKASRLDSYVKANSITA
ncbi:MAG: 30S ribosomal protein S20 [Mycoplasmatales bacterium]|nr:30S ribosomal protein S20 [Mycoplasmatales bacterium]